MCTCKAYRETSHTDLQTNLSHWLLIWGWETIGRPSPKLCRRERELKKEIKGQRTWKREIEIEMEEYKLLPTVAISKWLELQGRSCTRLQDYSK